MAKLSAAPTDGPMTRSTVGMVNNSARPTVLVVDDEPMVREVVVRYLERESLRVHEADSGPAALEWLQTNEPDLVVLDVMLPGIDGLSVLKQLRLRSDVPVIMLSARADEVDRIVGLELGADDYVVKPFSPRELTARVRGALRRSLAPVADRGRVLDFGRLVIDPPRRAAELDGRSVTLTPKEFDLLHTLAGAPRQVFSRRHLLELVWDSSPDFQDAATVTVHVGRLRQKIESDPNDPRWIKTTWGVGYRFEPS